VLELKNPVHCPLRFRVTSSVDSLNNLLQHDWIKIKALTDSTIVYKNHAFAKADANDINIAARFGDPMLDVLPHAIQFPVKHGDRVKIMQGYNGSFSHRKINSRYALDFDMKTGDTIYAADEGRVVGVIKDYQDGGNDPQWRDYANFITVYNNQANWFTQYVHLPKDGALVQIGDSIVPGQPIGLVGTTGFTSKEHLHFNVFKTADSGTGTESLPTVFEEQIAGASLRKGEVVRRN
jgi:murein DD-endopeptidase MepM/ murein hydrolase activator NlpD